MYKVILSTHILLGVATLLVTATALVIANKENAKKYLHILVAGLSLQIISGIFIAYMSETVTAYSLCQNIAIYSIIVLIGCVGMYLRSEKMELKQYLYISSPVLVTYSMLLFAIVINI